MSFQDEMNKRLRRVCGITDDTLEVSFTTEAETITYWEGYSCEYSDTNSWVEVKVIDTSANYWETVVKEKFEDLGSLMRALDEVEL